MAITEPRLQDGLLTVSAELEQQLIPTVARRLGRAENDVEVRVRTAAVAAAFRVAADDVAVLAQVVRLVASDLTSPMTG